MHAKQYPLQTCFITKYPLISTKFLPNCRQLLSNWPSQGDRTTRVHSVSWSTWSESVSRGCQWKIISDSTRQYLPLTFPSLSVCSVLLPVLAKAEMWRSRRLPSLSEQNKSALTDHASHDNHRIKSATSTIPDSESDRSTRWIKEVVHIWKEGRRSMNRDEGSYTLSHTELSHLCLSMKCKKNWTSFFRRGSLIGIETSMVESDIIFHKEILPT